MILLEHAYGGDAGTRALSLSHTCGHTGLRAPGSACKNQPYKEREFRLLKGIAEGTYNTKHAEAARLYYTTTLLYYDTTTYTHIHLQSFKLGHAHERRCDPNHREQHGVARHEAQQHDGARRGGHQGSNSLSARQANGAAMLVEVDAAAVAVLLVHCVSFE